MKKICIIMILLKLFSFCSICLAEDIQTSSNVDTYENTYENIYNYILNNSSLDEQTAAETAGYILDSSGTYGVDPYLATALFKQESHFDNNAVSYCGALGVGQLMPETAEGLGVNPYDLRENIDGGVHYLMYQLQRWEDRGAYGAVLALASYNAGPAAVEKYGDVPPYEETIDYVEAISANYEELSGHSLELLNVNIPFVGKKSILELNCDFAKPLRDAIEVFSNHCTKGIKFIIGDVKWLFIALITADLAWNVALNMLSGEGNVMEWVMKRMVKYGFILFLINNWGSLIANTAKDFAVYMGAGAAGVAITTGGEYISDPSMIVQKGAYIISPAFAYVSSISGWKVMMMLGSILVALILSFAILLCFIIIGFDLMMAYLEFYIFSALSIVNIGFTGIKYFNFVGEKGINVIFQVTIKLMVFIFIAVFMNETLKDYSIMPYSFINYLKVLSGSLCFVFLGKRISSAVDNLFGGNGFTLK